MDVSQGGEASKRWSDMSGRFSDAIKMGEEL
jgi:hypothetical protein